MFITTFFGNSFAFIIGIVIGVLNNRYKETKFKYFTALGFVGIFIVLLVLSQVDNVTLLGSENLFTWKGLVIYNIISIPFIGALIWGLTHERTWISKLFSTELFQVLGKSSYSFYLIHFGIVPSIIIKLITTNVFVVFLLMVLVSYLFWRFIEEPMNERIRQKTYPAPSK